ncbi:MAG TPA: type II toxin-antitoxin system VapC family toxin [Acidimicrobiales bacterium]|nr:type II toxin-antitoxin system VapC family toxin [Acidimicrobiales bacterium]
MKLVDVNLLIYAANARAPKHDAARAWLNRTLSASETVALPWAVLLAFARITTNAKIMDPPLAASAALGYVEGWLALECVTVPAPTNRHVATLRDLLDATGVGGNLVSDAHLAALAIEHGATLCSCDSDFARFPGLDWIDPIA